MPDAHKNFAYSTVETAPSPAASGTEIVVASGGGAIFPAVPFNATIWPADVTPTTVNAEIVRVTGISTDTLTITRTQEATAARTIVAGDQIAATITALTLTDVEGAVVIASALATTADAHANTVSAAVVVASALATTADTHANTVSAAVVVASALATTANTHANTVSAAVVTASAAIMADVASHLTSTSAVLKADLTSVSAVIKADIASVSAVIMADVASHLTSITGGGGAFNSFEIARVDPSGNNGTGEVGDLSKPFLTVQGAIDAIEAGSFTNPMVDIGNNSFAGTVTTALPLITFRCDQFLGAICDDLIFTYNTADIVACFLGCRVSTSLSLANDHDIFFVVAGAELQGITNSGTSDITIEGEGGLNNAKVGILAFSASAIVNLYDVLVVEINSPGTTIEATRCMINLVTAAGILDLIDSRPGGPNAASATNYTDVLITPRWGKVGGTITAQADLISIVGVASALATTADNHANTVSAAVVAASAAIISNAVSANTALSATIMADVASHLASTSVVLKADLTSVSAAIRADEASHITSTSATIKADIASVSAAIMADVASHLTSTSALIKTDIASVSAAIMADVASHLTSTSALIKTDIASVSAAIMADVASHLASTSVVLKADLTSVSAAIRADEASHITSTSATIKADIASVSAVIMADVASHLASTSVVLKADLTSVSAVIKADIASVSAAILIAAGIPQFARVTAAQAVVSTFPQKVSGLSLSIAANGMYNIHGQLIWTASAGASASATFAFGLSINQPPVQAVFQMTGNKHAFSASIVLTSVNMMFAGVGAVCATPSIMYSTKTSVPSGTLVNATMLFDGLLVAGGTGGLLKVLVGASTTTNTGITVIAGSYIRAFKVG